MLTNEDEKKEYDEYYIAYTLMIECLNAENIYDGIRNTLKVLCQYIKSDCAQLLKLDENGDYHVFYNSCTPSRIKKLEDVINEIDRLPGKKYIQVDLDDELIQKLVMVPVEFNNSNYLIATVNDNISTMTNSRKVYDLISQSFRVILKKLEDYEKIKKISEKDVITGFGNRLAYSRKIEESDSNDRKHNQPMVYTIVDIFRLKYVNDNFGHQAGDLYIRKVAEILHKYFPEYYVSSNPIPTGDYVYRIGGDEFAIISQKKDKHTINELLDLALEDVKGIDLRIETKIPLGMNYGIAERVEHESIDELSQLADEKMMTDKTKMYQKLGINRRK